MNPRLAALQALLAVCQQGQSLSQVLPNTLNKLSEKRDRGFAQNLIFGSLRWYIRLTAIRQQLVTKPLKSKDEDINLLIILALYQLLYLDTPEHAAVSETVNLSQKLKKPWARGFLNGVLRTFIREKQAILQQLPAKLSIEFAHPSWLVKRLEQTYGEQTASILAANNQPAPLCLRVNQRVQNRDQFLLQLQAANIEAKPHPLSPVALEVNGLNDISSLPGYQAGAFSVQDVAAQQAALILQPQAGMRLLDACAAPGGKTTHLLEFCNNQAWLLALEKEPMRLTRLTENLQRLKLDATCKVADAADITSWWDGELFDQILLDAPCSATGIIRRHPDIKIHRRPEDIESLTRTQAQLLDQLWQTLKPGGRLLYATCSILPEENRQQIEAFLNREPGAILLPLDKPWGQGDIGKQILPGEQGMDGFYYAWLEKRGAV